MSLSRRLGDIVMAGGDGGGLGSDPVARRRRSLSST